MKMPAVHLSGVRLSPLPVDEGRHSTAGTVDCTWCRGEYKKTPGQRNALQGLKPERQALAGPISVLQTQCRKSINKMIKLLRRSVVFSLVLTNKLATLFFCQMLVRKSSRLHAVARARATLAICDKPSVSPVNGNCVRRSVKLKRFRTVEFDRRHSYLPSLLMIPQLGGANGVPRKRNVVDNARCPGLNCGH